MTNPGGRGTARPPDEAVFDDDAVPLRSLDDDGPTPEASDVPAAGDADDHDPDDDVVVLSWWQHPANVVALVLAVALIGGMLGWLVRDAGVDERGDAVDVGFLHDMRAHHEQAGQMAYIFLGLDDTAPGLRSIARDILVGQNIEIGRMIQMLRDMGRPEAAETEDAMAWMGMPTNVREMPGMATDEELEQLATASGAAADELFVELMVAHHEGGIHMAERGAAEASLDKVRSMAQSMVVGQGGEIVELRGELERASGGEAGQAGE
jgi:uncharacterized protein (DUF305 family)